MDYLTIDERLSDLVNRNVRATLVHWREVGGSPDEAEFIVLWRKPKHWGSESRTEFGVHRAILGHGKYEGLSDLTSGDYFTDFDKAVKRYKTR